MFQLFAVMGNPVDHSLSPLIHQYFAKQTNVHLVYEKIKAHGLSFEFQAFDFFKKNGKGLNVTSPFKQRAFAMAQQVTVRSKRAGAANTLWMEEQQLHADNTDGVGFILDLSRHLNLTGARVLILGAGGAARGIISPLLEYRLADLVITNRTLAAAKELQHLFPQVRCISILELSGAFDLIINATSASLIGESLVLPKECFATKPLCYDLSYNQKHPTPFVQCARAANCSAVDGLGMLVEQAAEAFFIWHGLRPATQKLLNSLRRNVI